MKTWLPDFTTEVQKLLGYSPTTAEAYASDIRRFVAYLRRQNKPIPPDDLAGEDVIGFLADEAAGGCSRATLQRRLASLRVLERCLQLKHDLAHPFMPPEEALADALQQARPPRVTKCLDSEGLQSLWRVLLRSPKRQASRDLAIVALIVEWGFSPNALLKMELHQVDLQNGVVYLPHVTGNMVAWQIPHALAPLARYLQQGRGDLSPKAGERHVFISQQGKMLSRQSVWHGLRGWGREAGLPVLLTPRVLRATAAYRLFSEGVSMETVGMALGHHNPLSTTLLLQRLESGCGGQEPPVIPVLDDDDVTV